jgi:hypothetical protein
MGRCLASRARANHDSLRGLVLGGSNGNKKNLSRLTNQGASGQLLFGAAKTNQTLRLSHSQTQSVP